MNKLKNMLATLSIATGMPMPYPYENKELDFTEKESLKDFYHVDGETNKQRIEDLKSKREEKLKRRAERFKNAEKKY
jgi:hypothetical protein